MGNQLKLRFTRRAASANLCMTIGVKIERYALDEVSMAFVNGTVNWLPACLCQLFCHLILVPRKIPELLLPSYRPGGHKTQVTVAHLRDSPALIFCCNTDLQPINRYCKWVMTEFYKSET